MSLFVLDTDILTLFERGNAVVTARIVEHASKEIAISVVTVEEQLSGWYAQLRKARDPERIAWAYRHLAASIRFLSGVRILDYDVAAVQRYDELKRLRLKVRKMDLQIAATVLQHSGVIVTRNVRDFQRIPGLQIEDWSK
jgi:tRNA(fMet)-specific endonuclease VapC